MPHLPTAAEQISTIGLADGSGRNGEIEEITAVGKWEDEEERRFYENIPDLKDFVPRSVLGIESSSAEDPTPAVDAAVTIEDKRKQEEEVDLLRLEREMETLKVDPSAVDDEDEYVKLV